MERDTGIQTSIPFYVTLRFGNTVPEGQIMLHKNVHSSLTGVINR